MITLDNGTLKVEIAEQGAELKRVCLAGEERLWNSDPAFWKSSAPIMFPICGGLPEDKFTYNGREYTLSKHGFAKLMEFEVEHNNGLKAVFLLKDSPETLKQYPWHFELRVSYSLYGSALKVEYDVKNTSDEAMYMSIGSHEAYACPEGVEDYDIIFEKKENLYSCVLDGNLLSYERIPLLKDSDTLPLYDKYFAVDALVFKDLKSRAAALRNRKTGKTTTVKFDGFDYFMLWKKPNAGYICLEPWTGIPPYVDSGKDITEKEGISKVEAGGRLNRVHTVYFE